MWLDPNEIMWVKDKDFLFLGFSIVRASTVILLAIE